MADNAIDDASAILDAEVVDLVARLFDAARSGDATMLAAYLDAGVPVNLTNTNGDTLVMLAAYYGHESTVAVAGPPTLNVSRRCSRRASGKLTVARTLRHPTPQDRETDGIAIN